MQKKSFRYSISTFKTFVGILFLGSIAAFFIYHAIDNSLEIGIGKGKYAIILSSIQARFFTAFLAMLFGCFPFISLWGLIVLARNKPEVIITDTSITALKSIIKNQPIEIKFSEITELKNLSYKGTDYLYIFYPNGRLILNTAHLKKEYFREIKDFVTDKVQCRDSNKAII